MILNKCNKSFIIILLSLCTLSQSISSYSPRKFYSSGVSHTYNLVFEQGFSAPDSFLQRVILTNGQFPGPLIRARQHETVVVHVTNKLDHGFTLQFHGILQKGTLTSDGVPNVTQYEIPPNGTYRYSFDTGSQSGTFIYHAHTKLDLVWAYGPLIIDDHPIILQNSYHKEEYNYDYEQIFMLSQCWHESIEDIYDLIVGSPFADIPDTASILINGRSLGQWSRNGTNYHEGFEVITVKPGATYRFRVIGLASDSALTFRVASHVMKVIEVDGTLVSPVTTDHLELNSAQRYSALIKMNQPIGNYWITSEMIPGPGPNNGRAILHYEGAPNPRYLQTFLDPNLPEETPELEYTYNSWIIPKLHPNLNLYQPAIYSVPVKTDVEIVIKSHQRDVNGFSKFDINGRIHEDPSLPLIYQLRAGKNILAGNSTVFELFLGQSVQITFQNTYNDENVCEQHPWHVHGVTFHGSGSYNAVMAERLILENIRKNQVEFRDVVTSYPNPTDGNNSTGTECGYTVIRFVVDNPGIFIVHCHLTAHMIIGKQFILYQHSQEDPMLLSTS